MTDKTVIILHLKAAARPAVKKAIKTVRSEGFDLRVFVPYDGDEVPRIVREAMDGGAERIIAGGGDGTLNAVVDTIVGAEDDKPGLTFGMFPLGTANDFARGCGLPVDDLTRCLRIACSADGKSVDVGVLNGRNFINVASLGFGAEITATTPAQLKKAIGGAAYTLTGLIKAMNLTPHSGRVLVPGEEDLDGSILFAAVGNNRYAGGGFEVAPLAKLDDGLLDLCAIRIDRGIRIASIGQELDDPMNPDNVHVSYRQLERFTIESDRELHCNLDGEPLRTRRLEFHLRPQHLKVAF